MKFNFTLLDVSCLIACLPWPPVQGMSKTKKWFKDNIETPMRKNGIKLTLRTVRVNNSLKKPGPVFVEMARAAYIAGADYFYRINDDTEMLENWPEHFVRSLHRFPSLTPVEDGDADKFLKKPYGVLGPGCQQGKTTILTHDFVHRTHMEIFEMNYYPPQLVDWWMDDWISFVYGQQRTFRANSVPVVHHTGAHGQR